MSGQAAAVASVHKAWFSGVTRGTVPAASAALLGVQYALATHIPAEGP